MTDTIVFKDEWLSVSEIAELFGVTTMAVRYWIKNGNLKGKQKREVGRKAYLVLNRLDIEDYLCQGITDGD
jgi:excisionase family DNA binding protein